MSRGFTLIEMIISIAIAVIGIELVATFQSGVATYAIRLRQKVEVLDFEQDLVRTLMDGDACTCLTRGTGIAGDSATLPVISAAKVGTPRYNPDGSFNCQSAYRVLATAGTLLQGSQNGVSIATIGIKNLVRSNNPALVGQEYLGSFEVGFTTANGNQLQPARTSGRFYVSGGQIIGCGAAPNGIQVASEGATINNDRLGTAESVSRCPPGTYLLGGGFKSYRDPAPITYPPPANPGDPDIDSTNGCKHPYDDYPDLATAYYARLTQAYGNKSDNTFHVSSQCHATSAIAMCFKPNHN